VFDEDKPAAVVVATMAAEGRRDEGAKAYVEADSKEIARAEKDIFVNVAIVLIFSFLTCLFDSIRIDVSSQPFF